MKNTVKVLFSFFMVASLVFSGFSGIALYADASADITYESMLNRAEELVNYAWIPSTDIAVWNENPYNGKMYFPAGETVYGIPYTLFTSEVVSRSQLALKEYKNVANNNYSVSRFCTSVKANRTGPVYGSCCATFVAEVFGGKFCDSNGIPIPWNVGSIQKTGYTTEGVKAAALVAGDAVSNTSGKHVIWIGEVTQNTITLYECTPPVARKVTINKSSCIDSDGFLIYEGGTYSVRTKYDKNWTIDGVTDTTHIVDTTYIENYTAYLKNPTQKHYCFETDHSLNGHYVTDIDPCIVHEVYTDGCCKFSYITSSGGTVQSYGEIDWFYTLQCDINGDGSVNNKDLTRLMKYLAGADVPVILTALDVNEDGVVNNKDLTRMMKNLSADEVQ